ncbi:MAG: Ig-like domain-containing protein [Oscillospiraceae bacterium]|nr:Ig-like domain-containing protein [Oscillospiraceae bacterium]
MKKTFKSLLSIFLAVFMVVSLMAVPSSAAAKLNKTSVTVTKGYQTTLTVSGASSVTWSTGDKSIATVSKGKVVGKAPGTTYVYAKAGGTTLKCKVTVVAAKITASSSEVELDAAGDSQIVTLTVKGSHSGLTVGSTNKSVASASWVKPVEWNGDKIKIKITAKGKGTAKIKVYLKKYPSTCYKYIDVNVGDSLYEDDDLDTSTTTSTNANIVPLSQSVSVNASATATLQVYSTDLKNLNFSVNNSRIATVTAGTTSGNYKNFTVKGISAGTTTVRFYDKNNTKKYVDVPITVTNDLKYYEMYPTRPTSMLASTDKILNFTVNSYTTYYMLVPSNYDPAYANTAAAQKLNKYAYYEIYMTLPSRIASNDTYNEFTHSNYSYNYGKRYVLLPANYDKVKLNTVIAKYNNVYEYYTVYNERPVLNQNAWDDIKNWTVIEASTGKSVTRYMLVPYNYDQDRVDKIINEDRGSSSVYSYYSAYSTRPIVNAQTEEVVQYTKNGSWRYMVVPKTGFDILKRNEAIKNDTGAYEPYVMYETSPTADASKGETVLSARYGSKMVYVLCTYDLNSTQHQLAYANVSTAAPIGT